MAVNAITVSKLQKSYDDLKVLDGISFSVKKGSIMALLGPNGAGKTTTIRILSTLLSPDKGIATICGYDVMKDADEVRASIGLTGQFAAVDEYLTGEENLLMIGRLYHLSHADTKARTKLLLEQVDLVDASQRPVKTYSGGMKRRLDLAMSLIASPPVIFLDEPTTGLDPRSRMAIWKMIKQLASDGTTILLTTQYMEEADYLADNIVVIDGGRVIAEGDANSLKAKIGADHLDISIAKKSNLDKALAALGKEKVQLDRDKRILSIATKGGGKKLRQVLEDLERAGVEVENVNLRRPTLDDVFLTLTGKGTDNQTEGEK